MERTVERRHPERHLFLLRFLRRLSLLALVLSGVLWVTPRVLLELGLIGPTTEEHIRTAEQTLAAAAGYGAGPDVAAFAAAGQHLQRARALARQGQRRAARKEAAAAGTEAITAQKVALARRTALRQQAEAVYNDLDRQILDLEKLYASATAGLERRETGPLLSTMKATRQATGRVFLAYQKQQFDDVLDAAPGARAAVSAARKTLTEARR